MDFFAQIIVNADFEICPAIGWSSDIIEFFVSTSFKLSDCYKQVLRDLCDFSSTWTGYAAKILDDCRLSSDATINIISMQLVEEFDDYTLAGTIDPFSFTHCYPMPGISQVWDSGVVTTTDTVVTTTPIVEASNNA